MEEGVEGPARAQLTDEDDPGRRARKLAARWSVPPLLATCVRRSGGGDKVVSHYGIRAGDFVEVVVGPEIYHVRCEGKMTSSLHLVMKKVVKLRSAQDAKVCERYKRKDEN